MKTLKQTHKIFQDIVGRLVTKAQLKKLFLLVTTLTMASAASANPTGIATITCGFWDIFVGFKLHFLIAFLLLMVTLSSVAPFLKSFTPNIDPGVAFVFALISGFFEQWAPAIDDLLADGLFFSQCTI